MSQEPNEQAFFESRESQDATLRREEIATRMWEQDPERWKTELEDYPEQAPVLTSTSYHGNELEFLSDLWTASPFTGAFTAILDRLHGAWSKDGDLRAVRFASGSSSTSEEVRTLPDGRTLSETAALREAVMWTLVQVALEQVSEHLSDSGRLVEQDSTAVSLARIELGERIAALSPIETDTLRVLLARAGVDLLV
ncbi:hypothetical protein ACTVBU_10775 [Sanguibacter sp. A246]|uniref:hypothetical protein n=1 Tax=Sanguibacter sp. A246 TaxID=3457326 RepID=UPI003FD870C4